jgi:hypothetical protein
LPLQGCDRSRCDCRYRHHEDRRDGDHERRLPGSSLRTQLFADTAKKDRRRQRGRRATDRRH